MIGLIVFATAIVIIAVGVTIVWLVTRPFKASYPRSVSVARLLGLCAIFVFLTWPFYVGRWIFDAQCRHLAGLRIDAPIDAASDGFFDRRIYEEQNLGANGFHILLEDVKALGEGRVSFFETHRGPVSWVGSSYAIAPGPPRYHRFFLADESSNECVYNSNDFIVKSRMTSLAPGKCLAVEFTDYLKSRYEISVSGYHFHDSRSTTEVRDKKQRRTVAIFRSFNHFNPLNLVSGRDGFCPASAERGASASPHLALPSMLFTDRVGRVKDQAQLDTYYKESTRRRLVFEPPDASTLELHRIAVAEGVRSASHPNAAVVEVVVRVTKPVMLLLESDEKVVWHVLIGPGADVAAVAKTNHHAQVSVSLYQTAGERGVKPSHVSELRADLSAKLSGKPVSEQMFRRTGRVIVDGQSRTDDSPAKNMSR